MPSHVVGTRISLGNESWQRSCLSINTRFKHMMIPASWMYQTRPDTGVAIYKATVDWPGFKYRC